MCTCFSLALFSLQRCHRPLLNRSIFFSQHCITHLCYHSAADQQDVTWSNQVTVSIKIDLIPAERSISVQVHKTTCLHSCWCFCLQINELNVLDIESIISYISLFSWWAASDISVWKCVWRTTSGSVGKKKKKKCYIKVNKVHLSLDRLQ